MTGRDKVDCPFSFGVGCSNGAAETLAAFEKTENFTMDVEDRLDAISSEHRLNFLDEVAEEDPEKAKEMCRACLAAILDLVQV